ncbi:MAG: Gfo/Idh/MocA family oxidoreductase [Acidimicrobiales bacterium]|nr:Gfo/Idh/MocA family oxidoreductase [Acidimicrobiales bacterium]
MRVAIVGAGAAGARAARQLLSTDGVERVLVRDVDGARLRAVVEGLGARAGADTGPWTSPPDAAVVVLAGPAGTHAGSAARALEAGRHVVSVSDDIDDVRALLGLDLEARERGLHVVVGAGFSPGMSCLLARHAAASFDEIDEIHVAKSGTGGPACARQHHRALSGWTEDWRDGAWVRRRAGSGRELCWFPDPVGAADCYRARLPEPRLLVHAFRGVERATARMAATRRDRMSAPLPMLRPPHPEGTVGAVRVEVRGRRGRAREVAVLGAVDRPAVSAGTVAALAAVWAAERRLGPPGAAGLAALATPVPFLAELARRGVRAAVFEGRSAPSPA